jgi:N-methylhydantoinase A
VKLHRDLADRALAPVAAGLATDLQGAVDGILKVTVASLYAELSNLAAQRGVDPRDYTLVSFGGAGSLLACRLAEEMGVARVLVPLSPGTLCALGALSADVASHFVRSIVSPLDDAADLLADAFRSLEREARSWLAAEAPALQTFQLLASADMRYVGQSFEVDVPLEPKWLVGGELAAIAAAFTRCIAASMRTRIHRSRWRWWICGS